jgi:hypothetical protein
MAGGGRTRVYHGPPDPCNPLGPEAHGALRCLLADGQPPGRGLSAGACISIAGDELPTSCELFSTLQHGGRWQAWGQLSAQPCGIFFLVNAGFRVWMLFAGRGWGRTLLAEVSGGWTTRVDED